MVGPSSVKLNFFVINTQREHTHTIYYLIFAINFQLRTNELNAYPYLAANLSKFSSQSADVLRIFTQIVIVRDDILKPNLLRHDVAHLENMVMNSLQQQRNILEKFKIVTL